MIRILKNKTGDPPDILRKEPSTRVFSELPRNQILHGTNWCYIDGAWKEQDIFTGQGWFYRKEGSTDTMMGAMNIRRSLSPLHDESEALILAMECMKTFHISEMMFATDCSQLVKMVSTLSHLQSGQCSIHIWKNSCNVRNFFKLSLSNISQGKKTQWQISWHVVLGICLLLWFMLIQFPRSGLRVWNLLRLLAFCCKKILI